MSTPQPVRCRYCRIPLQPDRAYWWDDRPECRDAFRCTNRITRQQKTISGTKERK
ncbi:hypothetical protein [Streptomyces sp. Ac-502]|uniref:hypothetical protein n=1 Tax=Streptomyces sp. Ac-502 TaxID=3342801 RepID=UPI0038628073